ncbi:MAG: FMN-binding protein, partial [Treponema sp.]|nr:FMN-binding protein [Treponema sp.]
EVDVVSGATYTSTAIKEAVKNCVLEAMKDTSVFGNVVFCSSNKTSFKDQVF